MLFVNIVFSQGDIFCDSDKEYKIFCDNFENLDKWNGDKEFFVTENNFLKNIKDKGPNSQNRTGVHISTPVLFFDKSKNIEWIFDIDINFNPSSSNVFDVFLVSDTDELTKTQNGFFLRIGDSDDYVRFGRRKAGTNRYLINFPSKILESNYNKKLKFTVEYNVSTNFWNISFSINDKDFFSESIQDNLFLDSIFFGLFIKYNTTAEENFLFSNLVISQYNILTDSYPSEKLIISEIMIKPEPSVYLPSSQYLEIFNPNNDSINIKNWKIETSNTSTFKFNYDFKIPPKVFILLIWNKAQMNYFPENVNIFHFENLPQIYSLSSTNRYVRILNDKNQTVDLFLYNDKIFSGKKNEGGWSIERKDLYSDCLNNNWDFSINEKGGTPFLENSLSYLENYDHDFYIKELGIIENTKTLRILLSEYISEKKEFKRISNYVIDNLKILNIDFSNDVFSNELYIEFEEELNWGELYKIDISKNIKNCRNKNLFKSIYNFGITDIPKKNELLINEILYNPNDNGDKFLEIYNNSDRFLNLNDLKLVQIKNNTFSSEKSMPNNVILPKNYIFLSQNIDGISKFYNCSHDNFLELPNGFPNISISSDRIAITTKGKLIIEEMYYENKMHSNNIKNTKGISLERINFNKTSLSKNNWISASYLDNFATPGYENSNSLNNDNDTKNIEIINKTFLIKDGVPQKPLEVDFDFGENIFVTIKIYNSNSFLIYNLYDNEFFPPKGKFFWNGNTENSMKLNSGIYILNIEGYSENGNTYNYNLPFVIGTL